MRWAEARAVPLIALIAGAIASVVLAAEAGFAFCQRRVELGFGSICGGHALGVAAGTGSASGLPAAAHLAICPITLGLLALATVLTGWAIVVLAGDAHSAVALRALVRRLSRLPVAQTAIVLAAFAAVPVALTQILSPDASLTAASVLMLFALVFAASFAASTLLVGTASAALAFSGRAVTRLLQALRRPDVSAARPQRIRTPYILSAAHLAVAASGRGLRAPPVG